MARATIDALAARGLVGTPLEPVSLQRELVERLFMADGSLAFCLQQHQLPLRRLRGATATAEAPAADTLRQRWLAPVASGQALAAVAFAHLRRPGPPNPSATRIPGGWRLDGHLDWITAWDIADLVLLCARCIDDSGDWVVGLLLGAGASGEPPPAGLRLGDPLRLLAMGGTHTRPAELSSVEIPESQVLFVEAFSRWSQADAVQVCRVSPMVFGCIRGAIADLADVGRRQGNGDALTLAETLATRCRLLRRNAYQCIDDPAANAPEAQGRHRLLRAQALELAMRSAQAAVVARAGAAMRRGSGAERRLREAGFLLVQAQTAASRQESLRLLNGILET